MKKTTIFLMFFMAAVTSCTQQKTGRIEELSISPLPSLYISLPQPLYDSIIVDQDYKVPAEILIVDAVGDTLYTDTLKHIKTRGNSTFGQDKKAFTIKFHRARKLFNLKKSKSFVLLANAYDESHLRNAIGLDISSAIGLQTPRYTYVSLYINERYEGLYMLTNKVEINKHTLNITDLEKQNKLVNPCPLDEYNWEGIGLQKHIVQRKGFSLDKSPEQISGGYLLEIAGWKERYDRKNCGFQSFSGDLINIREPKHASLTEVDYMATFYNEMEQALLNATGYNHTTGKHYTNYLDITTFAKSYILNELLMNLDAGITSFYMYKDTDDKLYAGPSWDFDRTLDDNFWGGRYNSVNQIWAASKTGDFGFKSSGGILYQLMRHEDFQQTVADEWQNVVSPICHEFINNATWDSLAAYISVDAERDYALTNNRQSADYQSAIRSPLDFFKNRVEFLDFLWNAKENDLICVSDSKADGTWGAHDRSVHFYYKVGEPICYPTQKEIYNHDPILTFYVAGTDSIVPNGSTLNHPALLEMRWREPSWMEVQRRRIKKKFHKIFW